MSDAGVITAKQKLHARIHLDVATLDKLKDFAAAHEIPVGRAIAHIVELALSEHPQ